MARIIFNTLHNVNNPTSIHGIYPYRGKISSVEAKLITEQLPKDSILLDPFCGSGTILFEGVCSGLSVYGIDNNPLAIWLSKGKIDSLNRDKFDVDNEITNIVFKASALNEAPSMPENALLHFHETTANEIMRCSVFLNQMSDYVKAVFFGSIALAARGCNHYLWTSSTVGKNIDPKLYIPFYEKFMQKALKHLPDYKIKNLQTSLFQNDSRRLSSLIETNIIDYVFTSPPYFDGLDYTAYYGKLIYWILGVDRTEIKNGLIQSVSTYEDDMRVVMNELIKVTRDDALIIFVVGDKKIGNEVINGGDFFSKLLHHKPNQVIDRVYTGTSSQVFDKLNKTFRREQIVIWDKGTW